MSEPAKDIDLETVATCDLFNELRKRAKIMAAVFRPLADDHEHAWSWGYSIDGAKATYLSDEEKDRIIGLLERAKFDLLYTPPTLDEIT